MTTVSTAPHHDIAQRAYFIYLNRVQRGIPGNERDDWRQAAAEVSQARRAESASPVNALNAKPHHRTSLAAAARQLAAARSESPRDDLTVLNGIGPKIAAQLGAGGIRRLDDLAACEAETFAGRFPGLASRARRYRWIEQARGHASAAPAWA